LVKLSWRSKAVVTFKPLDNGTAFVLNVEGHKVIAAKVSSKIAKEIAGQTSVVASEGILSKLKAKLSHTLEIEQWLTVTNIENPLLQDYDRFGTLVAEQLATASGATITKSNLAISATVPTFLSFFEEAHTLERKQMQQTTPSPSAFNT